MPNTLRLSIITNKLNMVRKVPLSHPGSVELDVGCFDYFAKAHHVGLD